ncbi:MAG: FCD domain-containing protein [Gemmataceae bacterium]
MPETITDFIRRDLAARLREGRGPATGLTLAALASHYSVSLTPVRLAVQELIDDGLLVKQPNGRLAPNPDAPAPPRATGKKDAAPPTKLADIEQALTGEIIRISLRGGHEYLREEATADRLGIGRTVLRQLLSRLAGSGILEHRPRRGWHVRPFDETEMIAYLDVREVLELKALELARPHLERADLERMLAGNQPAPGSHADRLDNDLHAYLVHKSGNRYLQDFFERHGAYHSMLFDYAAPGANLVKQMAHQHRAILRALLDGDWPGARQALTEHIRAQRPIVQKLLRKLATEDGTNGKGGRN